MEAFVGACKNVGAYVLEEGLEDVFGQGIVINLLSVGMGEWGILPWAKKSFALVMKKHRVKMFVRDVVFFFVYFSARYLVGRRFVEKSSPVKIWWLVLLVE
ncbi:hypothetical protein [Bartonella phoceensis]|uniref:hypothetical protein n=1 Tax=Bartonella phoceensis TaxID=270249 RepID=UPI001ABBBD84|nr:hypothetical protein [Bartonella phoceensis]